MIIKKAVDQPTRKGPADRFVGNVWQEPIYEADPPSNIRCLRVGFEPAARTAWHTHPLGQTIHIETGVCRVQSWGGPVIELHPGDTCYFEPDEKHWHGAAPGHYMVHMAIQEAVNGEHVTWLEQVSDEQYAVAPQGGR